VNIILNVFITLFSIRLVFVSFECETIMELIRSWKSFIWVTYQLFQNNFFQTYHRFLNACCYLHLPFTWADTPFAFVFVCLLNGSFTLFSIKLHLQKWKHTARQVPLILVLPSTQLTRIHFSYSWKFCKYEIYLLYLIKNGIKNWIDPFTYIVRKHIPSSSV
jgi:hypothetical protein